METTYREDHKAALDRILGVISAVDMRSFIDGQLYQLRVLDERSEA